MDNNDGKRKEVYFHKWCKECKHFSKDESEDPCDECLGEGGREYTHKPLHFEAK